MSVFSASLKMVKIILGNPVYSMGKRFIVKNKDYETDENHHQQRVVRWYLTLALKKNCKYFVVQQQPCTYYRGFSYNVIFL